MENLVDIRDKLIERLNSHIQDELERLEIPAEYTDLRDKMLSGNEDAFMHRSKISENESAAYRL